MAVELELCLEVRGLWRMRLLGLIAEGFRSGRLTTLLLRSGLFDPGYRVNAGRWERFRLADMLEVA